jgi:hypothetical protein
MTEAIKMALELRHEREKEESGVVSVSFIILSSLSLMKKPFIGII